MTGLGNTTTAVSLTGSEFVDALIEGTAWTGTVTYAFPAVTSAYMSGVVEPSQNFAPVSPAQRNAARFALDESFGTEANDGFSVEGFTKLNITGGSAGTANIRLAQSDAAFPTAYAYHPGNFAEAGDVWFSSNFAGTPFDFRNPAPGNYAWHVMIHEIGHALGLKHGNEGPIALPFLRDSLEYSAVTTRTYIGDDFTSYNYEEFGGPQTFMMADIAALQHIYGADFDTNSGNTTYRWDPGTGNTSVNGQVAIEPGANRIFATIWDGGGVDAFDLRAYATDLRIDLRPGRHSVFSDPQLAFLGGGPNDGYARGNIFHALLFQGNLSSLVENVLGGSGDDLIRGNLGSNTLRGNYGDDVLNGLRADDLLFGGAGSDVFVFKTNYSHDVVADFVDGEDRLNLRNFDFSTKAEALSFAHDAGADTVFMLGGGDRLVLKDFDFKDLDAGDVII